MYVEQDISQERPEIIKKMLLLLSPWSRHFSVQIAGKNAHCCGAYPSGKERCFLALCP